MFLQIVLTSTLDVIHGGESSRTQQHTDEGAVGNFSYHFNHGFLIH